MQDKQTVVLDATLTDAQVRQKYISLGLKYNAEVVGLCFRLPTEIALERNALSERKVPEDVINKMAQKLIDTPVTVAEGFSSLYFVNERGEIMKEKEVKHFKDISLR